MKQKSIFSLRILTIAVILAVLFFKQNSFAQEPAVLRDGQHDFDFNFGKWRSHIQTLAHPLTGSTTWVKTEATITVSKIWDGKANVEELEIDGPGGHFEGTNLYLYNPQSHQWSQTLAVSAVGTLGVPATGEFKNGRGELYSQEVHNGRTILLRIIWSEIKPDSHRFEEAYSDDGGKTWETNLIANGERYKE
jgi:hypothetical protein